MLNALFSRQNSVCLTFDCIVDLPQLLSFHKIDNMVSIRWFLTAAAASIVAAQSATRKSECGKYNILLEYADTMLPLRHTC